MKLLISLFAFLTVGWISAGQAATLVNDFSAPVSGINWTQVVSSGGITSNYSTSFSASTGSVSGLVDPGFVTVDYQQALPGGLSYSYTVEGFNDNFGASDISMVGVTGFEVSLRKELNNSAFSINFFIIANNDNVYEWNIDTSALSTTEFRVIPISLSTNTGWARDNPTAAWVIGVDSSYANPASTRYNFSIDSISSVPEPSSGLMLLSGLGVLTVLRRQSR